MLQTLGRGHPFRVGETVSAQEWQGVSARRVAVEGFVIVGSILLAFAIDAWWDSRQQGGAAQRTIDGLEAAFSENVSGISVQLEDLESLSQELRFFLESEPDDLSRLAPDSAHAILAAVLRQGTSSINNEYLTELVDATDLSAYPEVAAAVAEWRRSAFGLRERRELLVAQGEAIVLEAGMIPELMPHLAQLDSEHDDAGGLAGLRASQTAVSQATSKAHSWGIYARYFRAMKENSESLVEMLRDLQSR